MEKMIDMGTKSPQCSQPKGGKKNEKWYPSLDIKNAGFMKDKKVGAGVDLHIRGEIRRIQKDEDGMMVEVKVKKCGMMSGDEDVGDNGGTDTERRFERARRKSVKQMDEHK